ITQFSCDVVRRGAWAIPYHEPNGGAEGAHGRCETISDLDFLILYGNVLLADQPHINNRLINVVRIVYSLQYLQNFSFLHSSMPRYHPAWAKASSRSYSPSTFYTLLALDGSASAFFITCSRAARLTLLMTAMLDLLLSCFFRYQGCVVPDLFEENLPQDVKSL
ncbi:hypothetical protein HKBW3S47_01876, partial [Candidatus Hakubella thermalkaliphila]